MFKFNIIDLKKLNTENYSFENIRHHEIEIIRQLRNNNLSLLRQNRRLKKQEQWKYFFNTVRKSLILKKPEIIIFSFYFNSIFIGYGGFVYIDWLKKKAELSYLSLNNRLLLKNKHKKDLFSFLYNVKKIAIEQLKLKYLYSETYFSRKNHIKILEDFGFKFIKKKTTNKNYSIIHELKL